MYWDLKKCILFQKLQTVKNKRQSDEVKAMELTAQIIAEETREELEKKKKVISGALTFSQSTANEARRVGEY